MADNKPNSPERAASSDASKVQPKKETVRINLPPKPTAAPTIKIPSPPSSGSKVATAGATQKLPTAAPPPKSAAPAAPPVGSIPRPVPSMTPRSRRRSVPTLSTADKALALAAVSVSLAVFIQLFFLGN